MRCEKRMITRGLAVLALGLLAAGCQQHMVAEPISNTYDNRHPIQVTNGLATLDVLPGGGPGGLTDRQVGDIQSFAGEWRRRGRGPMTIQMPIGGSGEAAFKYALSEIKGSLAAAGVPSRSVSVSRYEADGPGHLAPVRLAYPIIEARLPHSCGQWPEAIGGGTLRAKNANRDDWNYGCASQQNLAAMVEDPEDFIRPRAETPVDASRRAEVGRKYRAGDSTTTNYPQETVTVSDVGG